MIKDVLDLVSTNVETAQNEKDELKILIAKQRKFGGKIVGLINAAVNQANETTSVDERIQTLVTCLSDINGAVNDDIQLMMQNLQKCQIEIDCLEKLSADVKKKSSEEIETEPTATPTQEEWTD